MSTFTQPLQTAQEEQRQQYIVKVFTDAFSSMIQADADAWRGKFRKMAATPFAFYRGSAALFFSDMARLDDRAFLDEKTSRIWIHGDLHCENFGTYMNSEGLLVFDVNDFDEAWVAPFTWDLKRLGASLALIGFAKALSDNDIRQIISACMRSYARQVAEFAEDQQTKGFALTLDNTSGKLKQVLLEARLSSRIGLLDGVTEIVDYDRRFRRNKVSLAISYQTRRKVDAAFKRYLKTIPASKRQQSMNYNIKDIVELKSTGIGSAGYQLYSILMEGPNQALENDIILSMKIGQTPSASRVTKNDDIRKFFKNNGHRTVLSQRALQAHADPWIGYTEIDGVGQFVSEYSPYNNDLEWGDINSLNDILEVVTSLGQAVAKIHCVSDMDSDTQVVPFSTDQAIYAVLKGKEEAFVNDMTDFGLAYGETVRDDYDLFVDAFRNHLFEGL
ncbi:MAG: DUF2252 domain-containing protein [Saprospiraceae bacterium]|nr:DUF2252 domain-containing protein [Saprospiraceae bacterium]